LGAHFFSKKLRKILGVKKNLHQKNKSFQLRKQTSQKLKKLSANDFAREIEFEPNTQGRIAFGPKHVHLA